MSVLDSPTPSPRPSASPAPAVLSPSSKVRALLAQFSDSDSEHERLLPGDTSKPKSVLRSKSSNSTDSSEVEDDIPPRGRFAARLTGAGYFHDVADTIDAPTACEDATSRNSHSHSQPQSSPSISSEDEAAVAGPIRRRLLMTRKPSPLADRQPARRPSRSASPLSFPSPGSTKRYNEDQEPPNKADAIGKAKFLALVEKSRKERIAREAAEVAKRAVQSKPQSDGAPVRARGSSPADGSDEDGTSDDTEAVRRIQKQSKPTRKASKRALEEINRETQRMSRNMQLAHQAKTKKKITKESLLARFNLLPAIDDSSNRPSAMDGSSASNSASASGSEAEKSHQTTPPTSPLRMTEETEKVSSEVIVQDLSYLLENGQALPEMCGALTQSEDTSGPDCVPHQQAMTKGMQQLLEYQTNDRTVQSPKSKSVIPMTDKLGTGRFPTQEMVQNVQVNPVRRVMVLTGETASDDEIEIVCDRGLKRKYAVFESLPKRKAKEMPSHLALRSLAHLVNQDDQKRSMNAAELEAGLRRRARLQALQERREKIEELKAKGIVIQSAEERERDQQEVEDLVERARQEAAEIQKREKELAKKDGTYVKDNLDDGDDESNDSDFEEELEGSLSSESEEDDNDHDGDKEDQQELIDNEVEEAKTDESAESSEDDNEAEPTLDVEIPADKSQLAQWRPSRKLRVISDDEDDEDDGGADTNKHADRSPVFARLVKTPISVPKSARKVIPGLQMSDSLPIGLSQAFAATMADSQDEDMTEQQEQDSLDILADLPSPQFASVPPLKRLDSLDLVSDSQPSASQTQPLNVNLFSQSQVIPESPRGPANPGVQYTPSQRQIPFDLTQDNGYVLSPFIGNRFSETPKIDATYSTIETVIIPDVMEDSPVAQRRGRLQRRRVAASEEAEDNVDTGEPTAFQIMQNAAKRTDELSNFDKKKSEARRIVDEAAEESEDEYAGLGGASDDSGDDEENEDDRRLIDQDTQIGKGDEAKLAGFYADRERERDEKEVSKLLKDITTGALRRKRGVGDDLDLSDEEDAAARRREAKRREFARMRRELLKDEAVGKIAEDKRKEAFLRSIEDREAGEDDDDLDEAEESAESQSQSQNQGAETVTIDSQSDSRLKRSGQHPLNVTSDSKLNSITTSSRRSNPQLNRKPATLAEIRESVSFLVEEPDSQAAMVDLGLSDSEDEPEAYVNLDRHFKEAEADENAMDEEEEDLGDFIVDDDSHHQTEQDDGVFKKPKLPVQERAPFTQRRTKNVDVVDRLSLLRQASSSASSTGSNTSTSTKMAFFSSKTSGGLSGVPSLLRRATTNSSLGSMSGRETVSATGVVTNRTERGSVSEEKEFVRKGNGGRRNAVNYQGERKTLREEKMSARAGIIKTSKPKKGQGFLGGLFRGDSWE